MNIPPELVEQFARGDEIGAMPSAWATDFFSVIRSVYTSRQSFPFWQHLTFIIAGAFNPKELIQDDTVSNFNVDQRIPLPDFNLSQVHKLVANLGLTNDLTQIVAKRVHYWTDGQPYLSQWLCRYLAERRKLIAASKIDKIIDDAVERFFQDDTHHLARIKDLVAEPDLLAYTRRITTEPHSRFNAGLNDKHFRLAHIIGVIKAGPDGLCQVRNRLYQRALAQIEMLPVQGSAEAARPRDELRSDVFISRSSLEAGLRQVKNEITAWPSDIHIEFATLEARLLSSLDEEDRFGPHETRKSERFQILEALNRFCVKHLGKTFNEFCTR